MSEEETRRSRLDEAVREWLRRYRWPLDLDSTDRWLLSERLFYAIHWLRAAHALPCKLRPVLPGTHAEILEALLIEIWPQIFLGQYEGKLQYLIHLYQQGIHESGMTSFSV
jgi:hypothetical protein